MLEPVCWIETAALNGSPSINGSDFAGPESLNAAFFIAKDTTPEKV